MARMHWFEIEKMIKNAKISDMTKIQIFLKIFYIKKIFPPETLKNDFCAWGIFWSYSVVHRGLSEILGQMVKKNFHAASTIFFP